MTRSWDVASRTVQDARDGIARLLAEESARQSEITKLYDAAEKAFATDCLPFMLPGTRWKVARQRRLWPPTAKGDLYASTWNVGGLADHSVTFAPAGRFGPLTMRSGAIMAWQPYLDVPHDGHDLGGYWRQGIGFWIGKDLSWWYPGQTSLILVGVPLARVSLERFGLTPIERPEDIHGDE